LNILKSEILRNAGGAAQPNISTNSIGKFQIPLPSLETQKKIAAILDAADVYRQKTKTLIEKYDQLAQSLFLDMFGDTWSNPKGWKVMFVEEVANNKKHSIKAGPFGSSLKKEFYVERGYKIYGQEQVIKDDLSFGDYYIDERKFKELENCKVSEGDVLISLVGTYGKISVVPENFEPGIINPRLMKISPNKNIIRPDFLKKLLQNSGAKIQMKNQSRGGTMDIINVGIMRKIEIPVPPIQLQNQFADRIQLIERQKQQAQASLKKAEDLFNSLLQRAFKGELVS
jgi:type I restriction enzyme S subunit